MAGFADVLIRDPGTLDATERLRLLASLCRETGRAQRMVEGLLLPARMDAGRHPPTTVVSVSLREVCESVVEQLEPLADDRTMCVVGTATAEVSMEGGPGRGTSVVVRLPAQARPASSGSRIT